MNSTQQAIDAFRSGKVVIFPTDTAYGIGCRMDNEDAVRKVFTIKKRALDNALLVLVDGIKMLKEYTYPDEKTLSFIEKYWPGGLTVFVQCDLKKVPSIVRADTDILAVRWPDHKVMEHIVSEVGVPIIATSANISGESTPYSLKEVNMELKKQVGYVLEGECTYKKESTIVDCTVNPWKIIRHGAVDISL